MNQENGYCRSMSNEAVCGLVGVIMNKKKSLIILMIASLLAISLTVGGEAETVKVVDASGIYVDVPASPERIVVLPSTPIELIYALGEEKRIVGRGVPLPAYCPSAKDIPCVASCSVGPNVEAMLDLKPDLVLMCASNGTKPTAALERLQAASIPVLSLPSSCEPDTLLPQIETLGLILDRQEKANEFVEFIEKYLGLIEERTKDLGPDEKPTVYFECKEYKTVNEETPLQHHISLAGGTNIAANQSIERPIVSSEWVLETNPDIIIVGVKGESPTEEEMRATRDEVMARPGLKDVKAVRDGKVYIISKKLLRGIGEPIGCLYFAKWIHPALFEDIDPQAIHEEFLQMFFGQELEETYAY